jgi:hypothetical protein
MALKKSKTVKGIECNYWKIYRNDQNTAEDKTCVRLALYPSKDVRDLGVMNFLELQAFIFDGVDYTREDLYEKIKESHKVQDTNEDGSPKVDENDEPVMVETNWYADAEDD